MNPEPIPIPILHYGLVFEFASIIEWVSTARAKFENEYARSRKIAKEDFLCVDSAGRICTSGAEFRRADEEGAFPVKVYLIVPRF